MLCQLLMLGLVQAFKLRQTKHLQKADGLNRPSFKSKSKGGPYSRNLFCTGCAQVGDVQCEPLPLVALKTKVC